jgi:D-glycero-D-manno-heptose 1,7-bisphosphate phosphatase
MSLKNFTIDKTWSLFLDRDGVINKRIVGDYIKKWEEFEFLPGVPEAIAKFTEVFGKIFIVTNQQGIGKGLMTDAQLDLIHNEMQSELRSYSAKIDKIYYSPFRAEEKSIFRKPNPGLARKAKIDFPMIDFEKSIMIGDSISDMQFGRNTGMHTIFISENDQMIAENKDIIDFTFSDLKSVAESIQ